MTRSLQRLRAALADMSPAYFSMVMATGILSLSARMLEVPVVPWLLFIANLLLFAVVCTLALLRLCWHPRRVLADLRDHLRSPGFFTVVAACSVLGSQCLVIADNLALAKLLWVVALAAWVILTYLIFTVLTVKEEKPGLDKGINGGWLLAVVATQSLAVLGALIAAHLEQPYRVELNFFALAMWLNGGMLYIWMMSLIFYRYTFFHFSPADLSPPYWINMGAMAISTLAGSQLILNATDAPLMQKLLPFIMGFTVFYWATGTWWIPMLLLLAIWRHGIKRYPFHYDPLYWGAVFPLGMYAASTQKMTEALNIGFLGNLPQLFLALGLLTWTIVFVGQIRSLLAQRKTL